MHPLVSRWLLAAVLWGLGAALGLLLGSLWRQPVAGALGGSFVGLALFAARDAWRAGELLRWLRGNQSAAAPRDTGLWGELGYRIERALRLREAGIERERQRLSQFLQAIEASPNGVVLLDEHDGIEWCNREAAEHFRLDPERDRLQRITNLVRAPAFVAHLQSPGRHEALVMPSPDGSRSLSVLLRPYGDGQRLLLSQDITERERSDAMRRDFVANVSHEIRTPLTVLAGFVETLANLPLGESERARVLELMGRQTDRMQALVADLLTLARLEGSPRPPHDSWHDLGALLAQAEGDARALSAGRHPITLQAEAGAQIAGDRHELLSAVGNLAGNAVRYTPDGGRIDIVLRWRDGGGAEIDVVDTGVGIAREHLPRLTERFYRVDGSRSRETGGTGLGLAIVKHVVQRHGGELVIESEPGRGSTFRLLLPAARLRRSVALPVATAASQA
ncbi:MAG: phosphate regulon sensor histidine kinase PhoR [Rubrivivax sp.]